MLSVVLLSAYTENSVHETTRPIRRQPPQGQAESRNLPRGAGFSLRLAPDRDLSDRARWPRAAARDDHQALQRPGCDARRTLHWDFLERQIPEIPIQEVTRRRLLRFVSGRLRQELFEEAFSRPQKGLQAVEQ